MKYMPLFIFSLFFLISCQESTKKSSSSTNVNTLCAGANYYNPGCPGYTGSTTGTTGTPNNCNTGNNFWTLAGCQGYIYCQTYPSYPSCVASGTTTGGTTGTTTNPYPSYPSSALDTNWGTKYPGGEPAGSCSEAYSPSGATYTAYDTRKATMTIVGKSFYSPASTVASYYMNTSSMLRSVVKAKQLLETDALLKIRFKVKAQPESSNASPYCYGRTSGSADAGYTKLQFNVQIVGTLSNGSTESEPIGTYTVGVNSCTPAIDLSSYVSQYPGGIYVIVQSVKGNTAYFPNDYHLYGFKNVTSFVDVPSKSCWVLDMEVAADGTKTFD